MSNFSFFDLIADSNVKTVAFPKSLKQFDLSILILMPSKRIRKKLETHIQIRCKVSNKCLLWILIKILNIYSKGKMQKETLFSD